ncbi:hypothetical protein ABZT51_39215 [Streptomyces sp. NPDC005373]|uniref:DNA polymerase Y family protein n=1 Tax=Streptomyces sp. NPDC005373 TaxID=3156879 RepID=UPI0033B4A729
MTILSASYDTQPGPRSSRPHSVLRVYFHLADHPDPQGLFEKLLGLVEDITPIHQPHPADYSADLDITGALRLFDRSPYEIAALLQLRSIALYGVRATVGGGRSPMIATMAAAATRHGNITVIGPDDDAVAAFLRPQPLATLPGIGPATAKTLTRYGITTIGQLADTPTGPLTRLLGAHAARELTARAHGTDERPVQREALIRSTSASHRFEHDELDPDVHRRALLALSAELGARLRTTGEVCRGITLTVRYADRSHTTRSRTLPEPTQHTPALSTLAYTLYAALGLQRARVRQLSLRADHLETAEGAHHQLLLDDGDDDKARRIEAVADAARSRFGAHVITAAALARALPRAERGGHPKEPT